MKVISGGQIGADQGGLEGARDAGAETGGTAPYDWWTEDGPQGELQRGFGLTMGPYDRYRYPKRTVMNVIQSDVTALFGDRNSRGSAQTLRFCDIYGRPFIVNPTPERLADFLHEGGVRVLNVAGNRESVSPGIQASTRETVRRALEILANARPYAGTGEYNIDMEAR